MSSLHCTACGIAVETKCECHKPCAYMPANKAAALAVAAHPEWSNVRLGKMVGVNDKTIAAARRSTSENSEVEKREGRDGRQRRNPTKKQAARQERRERVKVKSEAGVTTAAIAAEEGVGERAIAQDRERVDAERAAEERGIALGRANPDPDKVILTKAQQKKLEDGARAYQRELDAQFENTVLREIARRVEEYVAPRFFERERDAERCRQASRRKGLFKREEYNVILRCVHPDRSASIEEKNEAFRLLHENRLLLLSEKDDPRTYPPIPTADEFMAGIKRPFRKPE